MKREVEDEWFSCGAGGCTVMMEAYWKGALLFRKDGGR